MDRVNAEKYNKYKKMESLLENDGFSVFTQDDSPISDQDDESSRGPARGEHRSRYVVTEQVEKKPGREPLSVQVPTRAEAEEYDIPTIVSYLKWHMDRIARNVIGREEIIRQAMFAILTKEHMLLLSRTGMAKSYLANYIFNTFENVRVFDSLATKDQSPDF